VKSRGLAAAVLAALAVAPAAGASQLVDRDASGVRLVADAHGRALLTYRAHGVLRRVEASGAINARNPNPSVPQVEFRLSYAGGTVHDTCTPYDGPKLPWLVTACKAGDGSYWAVQSWQRMLPDYGGATAPWELRLSHWTGPIAELDVYSSWTYGGRFQSLFGRLSYKGVGVHGFHSTSRGNPLDTYGRNLYLDTLDSHYGSGWRRENSFLAHGPSGMFCYGFYPHRGAPGTGTNYRLTVIGPGVTPDVMWTGAAQRNYDRTVKQQMDSTFDAMRAEYGETKCSHH
jgi:hypothetical protein